MMTSEPMARDFWSKRSDEAGTKGRKDYVLSPRACFGVTDHKDRSVEVGLLQVAPVRPSKGGLGFGFDT